MACFTIPHDFVSIVNDRLIAAGSPAPARYAALAVLGVLVGGGLEAQTYAARESVVELASRLAMDPAQLANSVALLGRVGAVGLVKRHGERRVAVTVPGGPQRGQPRKFPGAEQLISPRTFAPGRMTA